MAITPSEYLVRDTQLLPRNLLVSTGPVDHADWNYRGLLGAVQRQRFRLILGLLGNACFENLLEIGYGSGVFAPELARHCGHYWGVDIHPRVAEVSHALERAGVRAELRRGSVVELPFESKSFECIVGVSVLEFVDDQATACSEIRRVLKDDGLLIVVTPGDSRLLDAGLRLLTGKSPKKDFADRRHSLIPALETQFEVVRTLDYPLRRTPFNLYVYRALKLRKPRWAAVA